jgi:hypothetical protein
LFKISLSKVRTKRIAKLALVSKINRPNKIGTSEKSTSKKFAVGIRGNFKYMSRKDTAERMAIIVILRVFVIKVPPIIEN